MSAINILQICDRLLEEKSYHVVYQPIVDANTRDPFAFEALARFRFQDTNLPPDVVFEALHQHPADLRKLENVVTRMQLLFAPEGRPLFVNYDPHAAVDNLQSLGEILDIESQAQRIVFELIEDMHELSESNRESLIGFLKDRDVQIAIDDFGKEKSFFSFDMIGQSDFVKIDLHWFHKSKQSQPYRDLLIAFLRFVHDQGKLTIIEGIESEDDLDLARKLDTNYVQGFLFQDQFIQAGL